MVYGTYNYSYWDYKPTYNLGGTTLHDSPIFLRLKLYEILTSLTKWPQVTLHHLRLLFLPLESMLKRHFLAQLCSIIKLLIDFSMFQSDKISGKIILNLDDNLITPHHFPVWTVILLIVISHYEILCQEHNGISWRMDVMSKYVLGVSLDIHNPSIKKNVYIYIYYNIHPNMSICPIINQYVNIPIIHTVLVIIIHIPIGIIHNPSINIPEPSRHCLTHPHLHVITHQYNFTESPFV